MKRQESLPDQEVVEIPITSAKKIGETPVKTQIIEQTDVQDETQAVELPEDYFDDMPCAD